MDLCGSPAVRGASERHSLSRQSILQWVVHQIKELEKLHLKENMASVLGTCVGVREGRFWGNYLAKNFSPGIWKCGFSKRSSCLTQTFNFKVHVLSLTAQS